MDLNTIGEISKAASAVIAAIAFIWSLILWRKGEKSKKVLSWQQVVVFQLIQKKERTFNEIKAEYLQSHQQLKNLKVPVKEIQDSALTQVLIGLLEKKLIVMRRDEANKEDVYSMNYFSVNVIDNQYKQLVIEELRLKKTYQELGSRIIDIMREAGGKYTPDSLFAHITKEGKYSIDYTDYNNLIMTLISRRFIAVSDDGKLNLGDLNRVDRVTEKTIVRTVEGEKPRRPEAPILSQRPFSPKE